MTPEQLADQLAARQAGGLWYRSDEAAAELRRLAAENAALRKDAERYRWLRINAIGAFRTNGGKGPVSVYHLTKIPAIPGIPEETDAAIDAAIQKEHP